MKTKSAIALLIFLPFTSQSAEFDYKMSLEAGVSRTLDRSNSQIPFSNTEDQTQLQTVFGWTANYGDLQADLALSHIESSSDYNEEETELILKELFWQGSIGDWDWLAGKHRLDYGVSYGFRPIDLFLPYLRNPVNIQIQEGSGTLSISRFTQRGEISLIATDSHIQQQDAPPHVLEQRGIGGRWYQFADQTEWQSILYWDDVRGLNIGGSLTTTFNEQTEFHAEAHYQQKYYSWELPQDFFGLPTHEKNNHGFASTWGINWANEVGHNIIAEYWYDSRVWHKNQWKRLYRRVDSLSGFGPALRELSYAYALPLNSENLLRHNILIHWQFTSPQLPYSLEPSIDLLWHPEDNGLISTAELEAEITQGVNMSLSARHFGGQSHSVASQLPNDWEFNLNFLMRF